MELPNNNSDKKLDVHYAIGVDPGSKETGLVFMANKNSIEMSCVATTPLTLSSFLNRISTHPKCSGAGIMVIERPFAKTNMATFGYTWQTIGYIRAVIDLLQMNIENPIFLSPIDGNNAIGLHNSSTSDIAKVNMSYELKLGLVSPHTVSAYAIVKAAMDKDIINWVGDNEDKEHEFSSIVPIYS